MLNANRVHIPVQNPSSVEVVTSRLRDVPAKFALNDDKFDVASQTGLLWKEELERGYSETGEIEQFEKELWRALFKREPPESLGESEREKMRDLISVRGKHDRNHYDIVVPVKAQDADPANLNILNMLRQRYPQLTVVTISEDASDAVFMVAEGELHAAVYDFLNMVSHYV